MVLSVHRNKKCSKSVFHVFLEICCSTITGLLHPTDELSQTNSYINALITLVNAAALESKNPGLQLYSYSFYRIFKFVQNQTSGPKWLQDIQETHWV